ncbi:MAG TPA: hypothetical protein VIJ14_08070 [Rhabdochlamydiaceae bacterium]
MARQLTGNPCGRPEKPIDWSQFEGLCALQCTQGEIANILHVNEDTVRSRVLDHYGEDYSAVYKRFSAPGLCSVRRNQFVLSKKNATMAIWLGKIWLNQIDPGIEKIQDNGLANLKNALREILDEERTSGSERSPLEDQQPLLDQGCRRQEEEIQAELGATDALGGDA